MTGGNTGRVTSWWNEGHGIWRRHYGRFNLTVRKRGVGHYVVTVTNQTTKNIVASIPSGTLSGAKAKGDEWVRNQ